MHVFLTRSGRALEKKLVPLAEEVNHISVAGSTEAQVQTLRQALKGLVRVPQKTVNVRLGNVSAKATVQADRVQGFHPNPLGYRRWKDFSLSETSAK